jgi:hypothetical protein
MFAAAMWKVGAVGENSVLIGSILRLLAGLLLFLFAAEMVQCMVAILRFLASDLGVLKVEAL